MNHCSYDHRTACLGARSRQRGGKPKPPNGNQEPTQTQHKGGTATDRTIHKARTQTREPQKEPPEHRGIPRVTTSDARYPRPTQNTQPGEGETNRNPRPDLTLTYSTSKPWPRGVDAIRQHPLSAEADFPLTAARKSTPC